MPRLRKDQAPVHLVWPRQIVRAVKIEAAKREVTATNFILNALLKSEPVICRAMPNGKPKVRIVLNKRKANARSISGAA